VIVLYVINSTVPNAKLNFVKKASSVGLLELMHTAQRTGLLKARAATCIGFSHDLVIFEIV